MTTARQFGPFTAARIAETTGRNLQVVRRDIKTLRLDPDNLLDLSRYVVAHCLCRGLAGLSGPPGEDVSLPSVPPGSREEAPASPATLTPPPQPRPSVRPSVRPPVPTGTGPVQKGGVWTDG